MRETLLLHQPTMLSKNTIKAASQHWTLEVQHIYHNMPHTYSGKKRTKRPDFRPNGKRRLKAQQKEAEKDRLARVAANEMKGKLLAPPRHEQLPPITADDDDNNNDANIIRKYYKKGQVLRREKRQQPPEASRIRSLHKLLRQIVALEEKQKAGATLNEAQLTKLGRFDDVVAELEELQRVDDEEVDNGSDNESEEQEEEDEQEEEEEEE